MQIANLRVRDLDCEAICKLGLKSKILTHIRCHMDDARIAVETGAFLSAWGVWGI